MGRRLQQPRNNRNTIVRLGVLLLLKLLPPAPCLLAAAHLLQLQDEPGGGKIQTFSAKTEKNNINASEKQFEGGSWTAESDINGQSIRKGDNHNEEQQFESLFPPSRGSQDGGLQLSLEQRRVVVKCCSTDEALFMASGGLPSCVSRSGLGATNFSGMSTKCSGQ